MSDRSEKVPVIEMFGPVLQGEGAMIGRQTWFVRTGACDMLCKMCDSLHAVLPEEIEKNKTVMSAREIGQKLIDVMGHCEWVTFSGGNPALWDLNDTITMLYLEHKKVAIETQGTIWKDWIGRCNQITVSPKGPGMGESCDRGKLQHFMYNVASRREAMQQDCCLKIPCFGEEDLDFAEEIHEMFVGVPLYISVGNPYPPHIHSGPQVITNRLLGQLEKLSEMVMQRPRLAKAVVLPQLHVLMFGNEKGR